MLTAALFQGKVQQQELSDVERAGSLAAYYQTIDQTSMSGAGQRQIPDLGEIINIRFQLHRDYPREVDRSTPSLKELLSSIQQTGHVNNAAADQLITATRNLVTEIKMDASARLNVTLWVYAIGILGIGLALLSVLRTDQENIVGSVCLRQGRSFSSAVLDSLREGILASDAEGKLTIINQATREFHGLEGRDVPAEGWANYFSLYTADGSRELDKHEHPLERALAGEQIADLEVLVVNDEGPSRYCEVNGRPILDEEDNQLGAVVVMHDISEKRRAEQEALRLASIVECSTDAIIGVNLDGILVSWNAGASVLYGFGPADVLGRHASVLVKSGETSQFTEVIKLLLRGESIDTMESAITAKDGASIDVSQSYSPIRDSNGNTVGVSAMARDITVRKRAEAALMESQKRLAEAQRVARMGSWEFDPETGDVIWSDEMFRLFDFDKKKGVPNFVEILKRYHPDDLKASQAGHERAIKTGKKYEVDVRIVLPQGTTRYCQIVGEPIVDQSGKTVRLIGTAMDISERKKAEQIAKEASIALQFQKKALEEANLRLESLATSDGLTGLRNRRALDDHLEQEFARSSRYKAHLSLLLMDIDKFKTFNDSFGHQAGDDVLREVAKILTIGTRESDIVARYGGEELCIVLPETPFLEAGRIAERLRLAVANNAWERREVTVSIGVSTYRPGMKSAEDLLLVADQALYVSKAEGRNRITMAPEPVGKLKAA